MILPIPNEQSIDAAWFNQCFQANGIDAKVGGFTAVVWVHDKLANAFATRSTMPPGRVTRQ